MSVRTRKNAIVLAAGAILALTMPLTSITPASADSVLPAAVSRAGAINHAAALHEPIASGTQELTLRMVGSSPYFAAGPVYRHSIRTTLSVYREHMLRRCTHGAYQLVFPVRPVQVNQKCDCRPAPSNAGSADRWRIVLASHPQVVARCACGTVKRTRVVAARPARHRRVHRVRPRRVVKCQCRLVARVHRVVHRVHVTKCHRKAVARVRPAVRRVHVTKCHRKAVARVRRAAHRVHVTKCQCRLVRHVSHVVRVVRHTHCVVRALHRVARVTHVQPRRVQAVAARHCRRAAAHTTLLSFHRGSWNRPWGHRLGHGHRCGHWA
jgi:hypothetical protein